MAVLCSSPLTQQALNTLELAPNNDVKLMLEQLQTWPVDDDLTAAVEISKLHRAPFVSDPIHTAPGHPVVHTAPAHPVVHQAPIHQAPGFEFDSGTQFGGALQAGMGISTGMHQSNLHSRHQPIIPTRRPVGDTQVYVGEPSFSSK